MEILARVESVFSTVVVLPEGEREDTLTQDVRYRHPTSRTR